MRKSQFLNPRYFSFVIAIVISVIVWVSHSTILFSNLNYTVLDTLFAFKSTQQEEGSDFSSKISEDILLVGIDDDSLLEFGRWPWARHRHANYLNFLSRINNQDNRESAAFLDIFFFEPSEQSENDLLLAQAIKDNKKVFLETTLDVQVLDGELQTFTQENLSKVIEQFGVIESIQGDTSQMQPFMSGHAPLQPFATASKGIGHASYQPDEDQTFRRHLLITRVSQLQEEVRLDDLPKMKLDLSLNFERFAWTDKYGASHQIKWPLEEGAFAELKTLIERDGVAINEDFDESGLATSSSFMIGLYRDYFMPSINLVLALNYFNKKLSDIEVIIGEHVKISKPSKFNSESGQWEDYRIRTKKATYDSEGNELSPAEFNLVPEILIPIDNRGRMLINFLGPRSIPGGRQTFPLRSYRGYANKPSNPDPDSWRASSIRLENKIVMAGPFSLGMAEDEKKTPFGTMFGVEVHANALNTILMNNFIHTVPDSLSFLLLFLLSVLVAFYTSRLGTHWSTLITLLLVVAYFLFSSLVFDSEALLFDFASPTIAVLLTMLGVIAYRVMTEEKEKRRIQSMFGKYVSKEMVDSMIATGRQPELGGVDKEITVLFSDIRGFTTLSESMSPQELVNHLNEYLTEMTDIIFEFKGTLDKYVGDEVMCFWGAPLPQEDHALLACKCALKQMERLNELNAKWPPEKRIDIGIGLNSGIMTVGNMGSPGRLNYTLMGDNVNLGARLEGTNKQYFTHIIISEYTYGLVKDKVIVRELDNIRVKGKNKPVVIFELIDVL